MAIQYISVPETDLGKGIDARSAENQIQPGFVRDLLNADVIEKRARKRKGYQSFAGNIPVRVTRLDYIAATAQMCFTLDSAVSLDTAVSLEAVRSSPLVVYGKTSNQSVGPIVLSNSAHYYPQFTVPTRKQLVVPSGTLTISASEHGLGTANLFCNIVQSNSLSDRSYEDIETQGISISTSTYDVTIPYVIDQSSDAFVYFSNKTPVGGETYTATLTHTGSGSETFSIPTATHNLNDYNITSQLYLGGVSSVTQSTPESFTVAPNGDVTVSIVCDTASTFYLILSAAPVNNVATGVINAGSSGTATISGLTKPWIFYNIYLEQTAGGIKEQVQADSVLYDDVTKSVTLNFTNDDTTAKNFIIFYETGDLRSNRLCVTDTAVTQDGTDLEPQITLWGLDHKEIYPNKVAREGWVNHIDTYRRSGEQRVIAGLGGNLFAAETYAEANTDYKFATLLPNLQSRTDASYRVGPVFYDTGDLPARTRGYLTSDASGTGWGKCTAVSFDPNTALTSYTISLPNKQIFDSSGTPTSLSSVISTTSGEEDWVTIENMSYKRHEGTFRILQIVDGTDQIQIVVDNPANSLDYNDSGTGGDAGIFTDQLNWLSNSLYIPQDVIQMSGSDLAEVYSSAGTRSVVGPFSGLTQVPAGIVLTARRTSEVIPLRQPLPSLSPSVTNLVRGDMLSYTGIARQVRVLNINADQDRTIDISGDGTTATVTLLSGNTDFISVGSKIILTGAGDFSGVQTVDSIVSSTEFTLLSSVQSSVTSAILTGKTIQIDESLEYSDSSGDNNVFQVASRWIPIEAPEDNFDLTPATYTRYFHRDAYTDQTFIRSTMVSDNLYLTNSRDEVMKFDGVSLYRAGLPQWQPGLFVTQDTAATAKIVTGLRSVAYSAIVAGEGKLKITAQTMQAIPIGNTVKLSGSARSYTIVNYLDAGNSTDYYMIVNQALDSGVSASGTVSELGVYKYYLRLNMVDENDNIIGSAMTSSGDMAIELTGNAAVQIKAVGLPAFDNYDYDRIEVQIYRTKLLTGTTPPTYYLITTLPLDFNNTTGYIQYTDTFADTDLLALDQLSAIAGAELGINWREPIRAKYITTTDNKLVLGNVRDYPEVDMQLVGSPDLLTTAFNGSTVFLRKEANFPGTVTNMLDRMTLEWRSSTTGDASNFVIGTNQFSFDTSINTGAATGDWIYLTYSTVATTGRDLTYSGWWQIASVSGATVTVNLTGAASAVSYPDKYVIATTTSNIPVFMGTDGNLGQLNGDSFNIFDSTRRMALAINSVMRQVDISLSGYEDFKPWILARSGNDLASAGKLLLRGSESVTNLFGITVTFSNYNVFINSKKITSGTQVSSVQKLFPSRILVSYTNYPELYDTPEAILDQDSASAIDINPADGQEITGIIPFFGEAAFTAAQQTSVLVVFKSNSIYLVDPNQKPTGGVVVQRLETQGLGCTAPYSIAATKNGIIFANNSGIYRLNKNQTIQYIGKFMERNWVGKVDQSNLDLIQGHHYSTGRMYKVSIPLLSNQNTDTGYQEPTEVYVYNHTQEDEATGAIGAWSRYDNHTALGWINLNSDAYWASTSGNVYKLRVTGLASDYRDSNEPILFQLDTRPNDMGSAGIRKILDKIVANYRTSSITSQNELGFSVDLEQEYSATTPFQVAGTNPGATGMGDIVGRDIVTIRHSLDRRRGVYFSVRISNAIIDQNIEVAGVDYRVGGLEAKGITSAAQT